MNKDNDIKIELGDLVTPKSCSAIIEELIKYIVYCKQQIPYPYERLKYYIKRRKGSQKELKIEDKPDNPNVLRRNILAVEKHFKKVEEAVDILENTFKNIEVELSNITSGGIEEVAVVFGSTIVSPKDIYRIQIPALSIGHSDNRHGIQKHKHTVFRNIIIHEQLQNSLEKQVGLTNMFVLLKFKKGTVSKSGWFFPKDNYKLSSRISNINVSFNTNVTSSCNCLSGFDLEFTPFVDNSASPASSISSPAGTDIGSIGSETLSTSNMLSSEDGSLVEEIREFCFASDFNTHSGSENWFQIKQPLKGFRDFKIDGKPVVNYWHESQYFIQA